MNIANYSQSLPAKGWAHDSSLALWGVAVTGLGPEMQTLTAPSDCSLGQDWWLLLNHFFISSNAGTTIPGFLLEVQESLTARVSGMASDWFCIQSVLLSQTHGFPWGWCFPVYLGASSAPAQTCLFLSDFLLPIHGMRELRQSCRLTRAGKPQWRRKLARIEADAMWEQLPERNSGRECKR